MEKPDRVAYARRNKGWLIPVFALVLGWGLAGGNLAALAAGAVGLLWVGHAVWGAR